LLPATTGMTTPGGGGGDFFAVAAIAPNPARQTTPSATVLITWSPPEHGEVPSVIIKSVQNEAARLLWLTS
jgi:hypothetical protein